MPRGRLSLFAPVVLAACAVLAGASPRASADPPGTVVHELIPPDPHEDLQLSASLDGELPVAINTTSGPISAPDPRRPIPPKDPAQPPPDPDNGTFQADRNTKRPEVQGYDEPFDPSTAPFKRLQAFDAVRPNYELYVADQTVQLLTPGASPNPDSEDQFFADLVVDAGAGKRTRIPSVGPSARIVRARLGVGPDDIRFRMFKDGAENWFLESVGAPTRARLVMELTVPRAVFGAEFADAGWNEIPKLAAPLPENVKQSAREVQKELDLRSSMRPREVVNKLVAHFRAFVDSEEPPRGRANLYLDLALSKKGVCRHRAFAFMITAQSMNIPTRMLLNEAHAWVEVNDGTSWRRIDLGGAGRMMNPASNALPERQVHQSPGEAFQWPQGSERGDDMVERARDAARKLANQGQPDGPGARDGGATPVASAGANATGPDGPSTPNPQGPLTPPTPSGTAGTVSGPSDRPDERIPAVVSVTAVDVNAHRGMPLSVKGDVKAEGEPCANVRVELYLRDPKNDKKLLFLGAVATDDAGQFSSAIVVNGTFPLGDYDLVAKTPGDQHHCGKSAQ